MTPPDSDIRTSALIAMAQAISNRSRRPQHWMDYIPEAIAALDALNAALPGLGIKMVEVELDDGMIEASSEVDSGKRSGLTVCGSDYWEAMLAVSTNPLEKPE